MFLSLSVQRKCKNQNMSRVKWIWLYISKYPHKDAMLLDDAVHPFNAHIMFKKNEKPSFGRRKNNDVCMNDMYWEFKGHHE